MQTKIIVRRTNDEVLYHGGKKGMKCGYNDGKKNGKRTAAAAEIEKEIQDTLYKNMKDKQDVYREKQDEVTRLEKDEMASLKQVKTAEREMLAAVDERDKATNTFIEYQSNLIKKYASIPLSKISPFNRRK